MDDLNIPCSYSTPKKDTRTTLPSPERTPNVEAEEWEDISETMSTTGCSTPVSETRKSTASPSSAGRRRVVRRTRAANSTSSPRASKSTSTPGRTRSKVDSAPPTPVSNKKVIRSRSEGWSHTLGWTISIAYQTLATIIKLFHLVFSPFYPYLIAAILVLVILSALVYASINIISPYLFRLPGHLARSLIPSFSSWVSWGNLPDLDTAVGRGIALLPVRTLATPLCTLTGQACTLSLLSLTTGGDGKKVEIHPARPFWRWNWGTNRDIDVGEVARSLAKEAKGAKDIFESISQLSDGTMMDRLEYVRIWELGVAVQVNSNLEDKDMFGSQLVDLGNVAKDLSDELIETNAMSVNAFTWLQWEFASLVKVLSLPSSKRPSAPVLSSRLNHLLNRLSTTLTELHKSASAAHVIAARGSHQGNHLRSHLTAINADLVREQDREPGWKHAVDKVNHFFIGGEPSKAQLIKRDVAITKETIDGLSYIVHALEDSRARIKGFRDQIGFFDASMMGFHLGAREEGGIGPEEEVRMLADIVEEFGTSVGRAKRQGRVNPSRAGVIIESIDE